MGAEKRAVAGGPSKEIMNIVTIIPARGGSKGIPRKNLIDFCGQPLLVWSIRQALGSRLAGTVYVSSDDSEILDTAVRHGARPVLRPPELSTDTATSEVAIAHVLQEIEVAGGTRPDLVVFLQATSPLREPGDIDAAIEKLLAEGADSLFSMSVLDDFCIWERKGENLRGLTFDPFNRGRRQDRAPLYLENGSIYIFRSEVLLKTGHRFGQQVAMYEMPLWKSYEIDTMAEVPVCRYFFERHLLAVWPDERDVSFSWRDLDLLVYDFDGVMTDNRALIFRDGAEAVSVNRRDGWGIKRIRRTKLPQMILSTETDPIVQIRAKKLGIETLTGCQDKKETLLTICRERGFSPRRVLYIGNDLNDLSVMRVVGYPLAPADAHARIKALARRVTSSRGGEGVIGEVADWLFSEEVDDDD